jgi:hypothetical protein
MTDIQIKIEGSRYNLVFLDLVNYYRSQKAKTTIWSEAGKVFAVLILPEKRITIQLS